MPYIITTTRREYVAGHLDPIQTSSRSSRHAVATLWETDVRTALEAMGLTIAQRETVIHDVVSLPESGGAITLPDGIVIEVRPCCETSRVRERCGLSAGHAHDCMVALRGGVAAYNEARG